MRTLLSQDPLQHQKPSRSSSKDRGRGGAGQAQPEEVGPEIRPTTHGERVGAKTLVTAGRSVFRCNSYMYWGGVVGLLRFRSFGMDPNPLSMSRVHGWVDGLMDGWIDKCVDR